MKKIKRPESCAPEYMNYHTLNKKEIKQANNRLQKKGLTLIPGENIHTPGIITTFKESSKFSFEMRDINRPAQQSSN